VSGPPLLEFIAGEPAIEIDFSELAVELSVAEKTGLLRCCIAGSGRAKGSPASKSLIERVMVYQARPAIPDKLFSKISVDQDIIDKPQKAVLRIRTIFDRIRI
jgi:hypothetical protein